MAHLIGQRLGQYEIAELLGKGGMATVYRAQQATMEREVAIKVIDPKLVTSQVFIDRFKREAKTIAALSHPHILKVFDYGQQGDLVYLVMELLRGGSLSALIRARGALSLELAAQLLDQIAQALDYAHESGVIHRDLKPDNVLLDDRGNAFLMDFGIAKLLHEATVLTQSGTTMGTPSYMPPEQWMNRQIDARTDVYALGIILFEMLTGKLPFTGDTPFSLMHQHVYEPPSPIRSLRPDLVPGVEQVVSRALAKDPAQRFQSAGEMAEAFRLALAGVPLAPIPTEFAPTPGLPPRPTPAPATAPQARAQRPAFLTIGIVIGILAIIGAVVIGLATRTTPGVVSLASATPTSRPPDAATGTPLPTIDQAATISALVAGTSTRAAEMAGATQTFIAQQTQINQAAIARITEIALTWTKTPTPTPTTTPTNSPTASPTPPATATSTPTWTRTPAPTPTRTPTPTIPPTVTPVPSPTPIPPPGIATVPPQTGQTTIGYAQDAALSRISPTVEDSGWRAETKPSPSRASAAPRSLPAYWTKPGTGKDWIRWSFTPQVAGDYRVSVYIPSLASSPPINTRSARYRIDYANGTSTVSLNQQDSIGREVVLGTFRFNAGFTYSVYLDDNTGETGSSAIAIAADTVAWTLASQTYEPIRAVRVVKPANRDEVFKVVSLWGALVEYRDLLAPGANEYSTPTIQYGSVRLSFSWCADDPNSLQRILAPFSIKFFVENQQIDPALILTYDEQRKDGYCRAWATFLTELPRSSRVNVSIVYVLNAAVDDGEKIYPPGTYTQRVAINTAATEGS